MRKDPFVMCVTNTVASNFTANCLLAIGAKPAMIDEPSEAAELAAVADAVLVNVGTLTPSQAEVIRAAVRSCSVGSVPTRGVGSVPTGGVGSVPTGGVGSVPTGNVGSVPTGGEGSVPTVPWVLDPVACHALHFRRLLVNELLQQKPTLLRGNCEEINFLLGSVPTQMGGVTSLGTGSVDLIRQGDKVVAEVTGGVPMLQCVTATGCAQGAICAAFLGRGLSPIEAAKSASVLMKRAGERAWEKSHTPGSFMVALVDALHVLTHTEGGAYD